MSKKHKDIFVRSPFARNLPDSTQAKEDALMDYCYLHQHPFKATAAPKIVTVEPDVYLSPRTTSKRKQPLKGTTTESGSEFSDASSHVENDHDSKQEESTEEVSPKRSNKSLKKKIATPRKELSRRCSTPRTPRDKENSRAMRHHFSQSSLRHQKYQQQLAERRQRDEHERRRLSEFRARPLGDGRRVASSLRTYLAQQHHRSPRAATTVRQQAGKEDQLIMNHSTHKLTNNSAAGNVRQRRRRQQRQPADNDAQRNLRLPGDGGNIVADDGGVFDSVANLAGWILLQIHDSLVYVLDEKPGMLFLLLVIYRLLNILLIRSAFDPDEYWQTLEPAYCTVFSTDCNHSERSCCHLTWEWTRRATPDALWWEQALHGPVRSYLSVLPTDLLYRVLKWAKLDNHAWVARGPMVLQAITVAAPIDWLVYFTARHVHDSKTTARWALFASLTSWFGAFCWVRTYANCQEALLLLAAVALAAIENERLGPLIFLLGGISMTIRFTAVAAFVPLGIVLASRKTTQLWGVVSYLIRTCAVCGLMGLAVGHVVDRIFYGFWAAPFLASFHFNAVLGLANLYGSHPWHWYCTAGIPAVTGLLVPLVPLILWSQQSPRQRLLQIITVVYVAILSMSSHKEFRFLLPVLPLLSILSAPKLRYVLHDRKVLSVLWIVVNLVAVCFLGLYHQSGAISVNHRIAHTVEEQGLDQFSVHYLLPCHTTPSRSHLHTPSAYPMELWHLDCSPSCREENSCESDDFARDPVHFLRKRYRHRKSSPDFAVTMSETEAPVQAATFGLRPVARFPHTVTGVKLEPSFEILTRDIVLLSRWPIK